MPFLNEMVQSFQATSAETERTSDRPETEGGPSPRDQTESIKGRFAFRPDDVASLLKSRIRGQPEAVTSVLEGLRVVKAGLHKPTKPLFVGLLVGPTGVGKTEMARVVAEAIWGDRNRLCRVDMNTLSQEHYAAALTGPPPGYVGSKEGNTILEKDKIEGTFSKPGVVLFDEVEKASQVVLRALLNVFDHGTMALASGKERFDFTNSIIFMTSNIGARKIIKFHRGSKFSTKVRWRLFSRRDKDSPILSVIKKDIESQLDPEFINRIDKIIAFNWLGRRAIEEIVRLELDDLRARARAAGAQLRVQEEVIALLCDKGFDDVYGARSVYRAVRWHVEVPLANAMLETPPCENVRTYDLSRVGDSIRVQVAG